MQALAALSLNENQIGDRGCSAIAEVLLDQMAVRSLQRLMLRGNPATNAQVQAVYRMLLSSGRGQTITPEGGARKRPEELIARRPPLLVDKRNRPIYTVQRPPSMEELNSY